MIGSCLVFDGVSFDGLRVESFDYRIGIEDEKGIGIAGSVVEVLTEIGGIESVDKVGVSGVRVGIEISWGHLHWQPNCLH